MSLATRLSRIAPVLTAKERAILVVRAEVAGQESDPDLRRSMPREQLTEYNRLLCLYHIANAEFGVLCRSMTLQAAVLSDWASTPKLLRLAATAAAADLGEALEPEKVRAWRKAKEVSVSVFLLGVSKEVEDNLRSSTLRTWQQLRAIEMVWEELREHLDGEELVKPALRQEAVETRTQLEAIIDQVDGRRRKLAEPDAELVERFRAHVSEVLQSFGLLEAP